MSINPGPSQQWSSIIFWRRIFLLPLNTLLHHLFLNYTFLPSQLNYETILIFASLSTFCKILHEISNLPNDPNLHPSSNNSEDRFDVFPVCDWSVSTKSELSLVDSENFRHPSPHKVAGLIMEPFPFSLSASSKTNFPIFQINPC